MKRKVLLFFTVILMVVSLSGCGRFDMALKIKPNGRVDMNLMAALDETYWMMSGNTELSMTDEEIRDAKKKGYDVSFYSEDGYSGFVLNKKNIKLTDLANDLEEFGINSISDWIHVEKEGLTYTFRLDTHDLKNIQMLSLTGDDYAKVELTLPLPALDSNATHKSWDGRKLTWDIYEMDDKEIYVRFSVISIWKTMAIIDSVICIIAGSFLAVYLTMRKKNMEVTQ